MKQNVLTSGELAGLVQLRDQNLVQAQDQLDEVASALAQSMSTNVEGGAQVTSGAADGLDISLADVRNGNEFTFTYVQGGTEKTVRVLRVDDTSKLPLDYVDANGARVLGLDYSVGSAALASELQNKLGTGLTFGSPASGTIDLDDGASGTTDVTSAATRSTATALQGGDLRGYRCSSTSTTPISPTRSTVTGSGWALPGASG